MVTLELAVDAPELARLVMEWRNDATTRAMSFHHEEKTWPAAAAEFARYRAAFADEPRLALQRQLPGAEPTWHLFTVQVAARAAFFAALEKQGILAQVHYVAVNDMPLYRRLGHAPEATPLALAASQRLVSLPLYPAMSDADVERVIVAVRRALDEAA